MKYTTKNSKCFLRRLVFVLLTILFSQSSFATNIFCIGPGVCSLVKKMIKPDLLGDIKFEEIPMKASKESLRKYGKIFEKKNLLFTYPPSGLGQWSRLILKKHYDFSHSVFVMRQGGFLPLIYKRKGMKADYRLLNKEGSPFLPFYFYPYSLSNTAMDIYIFLKTFTQLARKRLPAIFERDNVTYKLEDCLRKYSLRNKVSFVFPNNVLSPLFGHLGIDLRIAKNVILKKVVDSLIESRRVVFFNYRGDRSLVLKAYGKDRAHFWDWEIFPKTPFLDPNMYLQETVLAALDIAEIDSKKLCK